MKTSVSLWDAIFGKKVTIELPMPGGNVKRVKVTERWVAEMQRQEKMKPIGGQSIKVHILDPSAGIGDALGLPVDEMRELGLPDVDDVYRVDEWIIGSDISPEQYNQMKDPKTGELYALVSMKDGKRRPFCLPRKHWLETKKQMGSM